MIRATQILRALHAEGRKRGLDHGALHDLAAEYFGVDSLARLSEPQAHSLFKRVAGRGFQGKKDRGRPLHRTLQDHNEDFHHMSPSLAFVRPR